MVDIRYVPFRLNGKLYAIWTESKLRNGNTNSPVTRLQTCYPLEEPEKMEELAADYREVMINEKLSAFVKKIT